MFGLVRESRLREAERQRDRAMDAAIAEERRSSEWMHMVTSLRAELAQTWIRNARGQLVRHPSYVAQK